VRKGIDQGVHSYERLPARKSRNSGELVNFHDFHHCPCAAGRGTGSWSFAVQEVFLIGGAFIGIAGRNRHFDIERSHQVKELGQLIRLGIVEHGAIDLNAETLRLGQLDRFERRQVPS
jgi:hypothetical protein